MLIDGDTIEITKAMIAAVKRTEKFYEGEDLDQWCICSAAMEAREFDKFWNCVGALSGHNEAKFIRALKKAVWK